MIIKDKPFHVPACQALACWFYFPPVFLGVAISGSGCVAELVRRWPGFVQLELSQVRLIGYLVRRRFYANFDRGLNRYQSGLVHAGGIW